MNAEINDTGSRISSMKFSTQKYTKYIKMEQQKKMMTKTNFKQLVNKIIDKNNWKQKWTKIKEFIKTNKLSIKQQLGANDDNQFNNEQNYVFNLILALYADEDQQEVFNELDKIYAYNPAEVEFYIPQLCTYLFHFSQARQDLQEKDNVPQNIEEKKQEQNFDDLNNVENEDAQNQESQSEGLKLFLIKKSGENLRFAHLMFWCIFSQLDDTQSIQMSKHKNKEIWDILNQLICSHDQNDNSEEIQENQFFQSFIKKQKSDTGDTGGSNQFNYGQVETLECHARMVRFDQQMMRALSNNMEEHPLFLSTPKFISDLLFVSEVLKGIEKDDRNHYLKEVIQEINKSLPSNVYIPIRQETTNLPDPLFKKKILKKNHQLEQSNYLLQKVGPLQVHRVLKISTDNAFCLHSKERVPYHIIIEVLYDENIQDEYYNDDENNNQDNENFNKNNQFLSQTVQKIKAFAKGNSRKKSLEKAKSSKDVQLYEIQRSKSIIPPKRLSNIMPGKSKDKKKLKTNNKQIFNKLSKKNFFGENFIKNNKSFDHEYFKTDTKDNNILELLNDDSPFEKRINHNKQLIKENIPFENPQSNRQIQEDEEKLDNSNILFPKNKSKISPFRQAKSYESDKNFDDNDQNINLDHRDSGGSGSFEEKQIEEIAGYNINSNVKNKNDNQTDFENVEEGFSSDSQLEDSKNENSFAYAKSLTNCIFGKYELPEDQQQQKIKFKKPTSLFGEKTFSQVCKETKKKSIYGNLKNYGIISVIVKSPDNLTQEQFASQLIRKFQTIFDSHKLKLWLKPFNIIATCPTGGLIETIPDAVSIATLKKQNPHLQTLRQYFIYTFKQIQQQEQGIQNQQQIRESETTDSQIVKQDNAQNKPLTIVQRSQKLQQDHKNVKRYQQAKKNFMRSMAGYSLLCYILQIKDRHNGNILLDSKGHMVHVDFGFMFSNSPGNLNFESMTFKLTQEYIDVLGGQGSKFFLQFQQLMIKGFMALREHAEEIISFVEMSIVSGIDLPCFKGRDRVLSELRDKFKLDMTATQCKEHILRIITEACDNWRTRWYDKFQKYSVGIW